MIPLLNLAGALVLGVASFLLAGQIRALLFDIEPHAARVLLAVAAVSLVGA